MRTPMKLPSAREETAAELAGMLVAAVPSLVSLPDTPAAAGAYPS